MAITSVLIVYLVWLGYVCIKDLILNSRTNVVEVTSAPWSNVLPALGTWTVTRNGGLQAQMTQTSHKNPLKELVLQLW